MQEESKSLFHIVGVTVAASQIFETVFVLGVRLALKQADIQVLEVIEPISESRSFKQPAKALLKELSQAQSIEPGLESRITKLIDERHRVIHRLFREFGWPAAMSAEKEAEFRRLCSWVTSESGAMSIVFTDLVLSWMKRFPATSPTAIEYEGNFKGLAAHIRAQSEAASAANPAVKRDCAKARSPLTT